MNTLKTATVVVVLLAVLYGVYRVLNMPDPQVLEQQLLSIPGAADGGAGVTGSTAVAPQVELPAAAVSSSASPSTPSSLTATPLIPGPPASSPAGSSSNSFSGPLTPSPVASAAAPSTPIDGPPPATTAPYTGNSLRDDSLGASEPPLRGSREPDPTLLRAFDRTLAQAKMLVEQGQYREALAALSVYYDLPGLSQSQEEQLLRWLDPLAGKVIYSTDHLLEPPHRVAPGDTLESIAKRYQVPWQLLQNINRRQVSDPQSLAAGTELKVVRGPFRATVNLDKQRLTLFLGELYAGYFPVQIGNDPAPVPGVYTVQDKQQWQVYQTRTGQTIPAGHPANPYGEWWLGLGNGLCIHGRPDLVDEGEVVGCISLDPIDAADVYAILSIGSRVEIFR